MNGGFEARKQVGDAHEVRIAAELHSQGWETARWGQEILPARIRGALRDSRWRYFPDLVAERNGVVVTIDGKDRMRSAGSDRYALSRGCISFGLQFMAAFGIPVLYVFGDMRVLTPQEVMAYGTQKGPPSGAYYLVPTGQAHGFMDVFGPRGWGLAA